MPNRLLPLLLASLLAAIASSAEALTLTGQRDIHDPSRIHELNGRYYTYGTGGPGGAIVTRYSDNLVNWSNGPAAIAAVPAWALQMVPENGGGMWAPVPSCSPSPPRIRRIRAGSWPRCTCLARS